MPILQFLKNPNLFEDQDLSFKTKFFKTIFYRIATLAITILLSIFLNILMQHYGITDDQNMLYDFFNQNKRRYVLLTAVVLWPILEELVFRSLLRPNLWVIYIWLLWLIYLISHKFIANQINLHQLYSFRSFLPYSIYILWFILAIIWLFYLLRRFHIHIYFFIKKYFYLFFWFSCIVFGLVHIMNFDKFVAPRYVYMFMVLPQLTIAVFLAFVRTNFGLWYSIFYHMLHNAILSFMLVYVAYLWLDLTKISETNIFTNPEIAIVMLVRIFLLLILFVAWIRNIYIILIKKD